VVISAMQNSNKSPRALVEKVGSEGG
jgi:hypothetical protein